MIDGSCIEPTKFFIYLSGLSVHAPVLVNIFRMSSIDTCIKVSVWHVIHIKLMVHVRRHKKEIKELQSMGKTFKRTFCQVYTAINIMKLI